MLNYRRVIIWIGFSIKYKIQLLGYIRAFENPHITYPCFCYSPYSAGEPSGWIPCLRWWHCLTFHWQKSDENLQSHQNCLFDFSMMKRNKKTLSIYLSFFLSFFLSFYLSFYLFPWRKNQKKQTKTETHLPQQQPFFAAGRLGWLRWKSRQE